MIVKQYIKDFENMGLGMFVHFGIYSIVARGEWAKHCLNIPDSEYYTLCKEFAPKEGWADELARVASEAGCKYITLTSRHHDGYSLYDTHGLSEIDSMNSCGRDLMAEFVTACRAYNIKPFFYHTLLDWHAPTYKTDFKAYLKYLRASVELICKNYGEIGGIWFDGMWDKPDADWEEDALYSLIRSYQPNAMIINNTGLDAQGALGHIELDSVTFERGTPHPLNLETSPKYIASEMCQIFNDHWGYAKNDFNYKSLASIIEDFASCRKCGSNFLLNVGPMSDGSLRPIDKGMLDEFGKWVKINDEALHIPRPCNIEIEDKPKDFILSNGNTYYLFVHSLPIISDEHVAKSWAANYKERFKFDKKIISAEWLDNGKQLDFEQEGDRATITTLPHLYGENFVVRIVKINTED